MTSAAVERALMRLVPTDVDSYSEDTMRLDRHYGARRPGCSEVVDLPEVHAAPAKCVFVYTRRR